MSEKSFIDENIRRHYEVKRKIGTGAYGYVWECIERRSRKRVAIKKIQEAFRNPTDAQRTYREVALLREFRRHPNIITLYEVRRASNNMDIYLVFEHMEIDLHNLINRKDKSLCDHHYQLIIYQILKALKYIHSGGIVHRDLKPSNILLNSRCVVKVGDLGLARTLRSASQSWTPQDQLMTGYVATRWYRPPEILLSSKRYTKGVDLWSVGCILAEMILGRPLFQGENTEKQLKLVMAAIPKPSSKDVEAVKLLGGNSLSIVRTSNYGELGKMLENNNATRLSSDLVQSLLHFNPDKRLTASQALQHPYLSRISKGGITHALRHVVTLALRDDIQLTVDDYRNYLYRQMESKSSPRLMQSPRHSDVDGVRRVKSSISQHHQTGVPSLAPLRKQVRSKIPLRLSHYKTETIKSYVPRTSRVKSLEETTHTLTDMEPSKARRQSDKPDPKAEIPSEKLCNKSVSESQVRRKKNFRSDTEGKTNINKCFTRSVAKTKLLQNEPIARTITDPVPCETKYYSRPEPMIRKRQTYNRSYMDTGGGGDGYTTTSKEVDFQKRHNRVGVGDICNGSSFEMDSKSNSYKSRWESISKIGRQSGHPIDVMVKSMRSSTLSRSESPMKFVKNGMLVKNETGLRGRVNGFQKSDNVQVMQYKTVIQSHGSLSPASSPVSNTSMKQSEKHKVEECWCREVNNRRIKSMFSSSQDSGYLTSSSAT